MPAYHKQFIRLASRVQWTERALIGAFKGGLKQEVLLEMQVQNYDTLEECFAMACICEVRLEEKRALKKTHKFEKQKKKSSHSSSSRSKGNELVPYNNRREFKPNSKSGKGLPIRYLTPKQIEEYRRKGLCYRCEDKWDKNHQCKGLNSIVVVYDPEDSSSSDSDSSSSSRRSSSSSSEEEVRVRRKPKKPESKKEETPTPEVKQEENESLHSSMQDPHKPNAMRVFGRINGHKVLILLDNGATNNFLTEEAAKRCKVTLQPGKPQTIIVGGGYRLKCLQEGKDMEVTINKRAFKVDSLVIPLEGVDLLLGEGEPITLQGLASTVHPKAALRAIDAEQPACWNIAKAQNRMRHVYNKGRKDREFEVGEYVWLKRLPLKQKSLMGQPYSKLLPRYYHPYPVLQKVGKAAYRLGLPRTALVHPPSSM
ncbi:hypothetical protein EJ110_NYTH48243 [Nymphaea thermarum]|nr:hypothetical protein EJ110_NYTH48243 [Nymphaea thermarum]